MIYFIIGILGVIADFITKKLAVIHLKGGDEIVLIEKVFKLSYVENKGAAFGIFQDMRYVFIVLTVLIVFFLIWLLKSQKIENRIFKTGITLMISGAIGNFIDRVYFGYVRDFIRVDFIEFPVFNIADCFVCIGAGLYILYAFSDMFKKKEEKESDDKELTETDGNE